MALLLFSYPLKTFPFRGNNGPVFLNLILENNHFFPSHANNRTYHQSETAPGPEYRYSSASVNENRLIIMDNDWDPHGPGGSGYTGSSDLSYQTHYLRLTALITQVPDNCPGIPLFFPAVGRTGEVNRNETRQQAVTTKREPNSWGYPRCRRQV